MKTTNNMKRILACLLLSASYLLTSAQGIIVYKTDGTQIKVPYEQLDSIAAYQTDDGPVVPPSPGVDPITIDDLAGIWEDGGLGFDDGYTMTFSYTNDNVLVKQNDEIVYQGQYTLENNVVSFVIDGVTYKSAAGLAGGKSVLVMKRVIEDLNRGTYEDLAFILVKKGKTVSTRKEDIQGQWVWWETYVDEETGETERDARISHKFDGNTMELILPAWGKKYVGTYTYENGFIHFEITEGYTSREPGTGYGVGEGDLDLSTLEGTWNTLYREHWEFDSLDGWFFVVGDEAYSFIMMPCVCTKFIKTR